MRNERYFQELLYKRYAPPLLRLCLYKLKDRDTAMTVVNNAFLKVYKKLHTYSFSGSFEAWLHRIVYRSIADYFQSESKRIKRETPREAIQSVSAENLLDRLYFDDLLKLATQLPPMTYKVFVMYLVEGYKHSEIAEKLKISINTSKWHVAHAKKRMRAIIKVNYPEYE